MTTEQSSPRTLAEDLRSRADTALSALLRARPDLLNPVPNDLTQLATRAATRASVVRALERLDRFALQTVEALAVAPDGSPYETLRDLMRAEAPDTGKAVDAALPRALATLRTQALVWGDDDRPRLVRAARDLLAPAVGSPSPTGLGPAVAEVTSGVSHGGGQGRTSPRRLQEILAETGLGPTHDPVSAVAALTELFTDSARMTELLATAPAEATAVLGKLAWGPPYGEVADVNTPPAPVRWLLARGLLFPAGPRNVVLPREVALHLRGGRAHRDPEPLPPPVEPVRPAVPLTPVVRDARTPGDRRPGPQDAAAAGQAFAAVRTVEELLRHWETGGPAVLRAGGLSVRDLRRTATALDVPEATAAFWLETVYGAGLVASDGEVDEAYAPTPAYDEWLRLPTEERWTALATAWLAATRTAGLVGTRDPKGRALSALGPDLDRSLAPEIRRRILELLAGLPEGSAAAPDALLARLRWERPLRGGVGMDALRADLVRWTVTEAELLGLTGHGAIASYARELLPGVARAAAPEPGTATGAAAAAGVADPAGAAALLRSLLPEPLDHVLLQADLTAVAPGPLHAPLAETLNVLADIESKGGATVYRFTPQSVRRALDAGRTAAELHAFLTAHSRTPVPQPLSYLIDDVARRHGQLRVGAASAYVRCDDDALLGELLADRRTAALGLRRLAPTVLAAQVDPGTLLERLRAMGFAPAAESADGGVLITRADARRTAPRTPPVPVVDGPPVPDDTLLGAAVKAIRAGDRASTAVHRRTVPAPSAEAAGRERLPRTAAADTLATMQAAVLTGEAVWIGYVNADGAASQRVIGPIKVEGGYVTAYDHTTEEVRAFALHRITGVAELADDPA